MPVKKIIAIIKIPIKNIENGKVCVPAGILNSFLNNILDNRNITLETKDGVLNMSSDENNVSIKTLPTDDFPTIPLVDEGKVYKINPKDLQNGIRSVIYSSSTSAVKPELSSVYMYSNDDSIVFVATDSFRLAEKLIKTNKKKLDIPGVLIPFKNAADILKIIETTNSEIQINSTKNQISFVFDETYLVSRVIDGTFPDYKQIIPKEEKTKTILLKQDLINSLKVSNIFSDNFNQINITTDSKKKKIETKTKNANVGESSNTINANIEGEDISINFNYRYIVDCLSSIPTDSITLLFNGLNRPLIIRGVNDSSFTYLVMPMNR